jgi:putative transposase
VKYAWINKHRQEYATTMMCELLSVSRSGLNAARGREPSKRACEDKQLVEQIRHGQRKHRGRYGRRRPRSARRWDARSTISVSGA